MGRRPGEEGLGGSSPSPPPEAWLDAVDTDLVSEPVAPGPALQQGEGLAGEWQPGGRAPPGGGGRKEEGGRCVGLQRTRPGASRLMLWGPRSLLGPQAVAPGPRL